MTLRRHPATDHKMGKNSTTRRNPAIIDLPRDNGESTPHLERSGQNKNELMWNCGKNETRSFAEKHKKPREKREFHGVIEKI